MCASFFSLEEPGEDRVVEAPCLEDRVVEAPCLEDRVVEAPCLEDRVVEAPCLEDRVVEAPCLEDCVVEAPCLEEPSWHAEDTSDEAPEEEPDLANPELEERFRNAKGSRTFEGSDPKQLFVLVHGICGSETDMMMWKERLERRNKDWDVRCSTAITKGTYFCGSILQDLGALLAEEVVAWLKEFIKEGAGSSTATARQRSTLGLALVQESYR